jgi:hypothetical protein
MTIYGKYVRGTIQNFLFLVFSGFFTDKKECLLRIFHTQKVVLKKEKKNKTNNKNKCKFSGEADFKAGF